MSLLSVANMKLITDRVAREWEQVRANQGTKATGPTTPNTVGYTAQQMVNLVLGLNDSDQVLDLLSPAVDLVARSNVDFVFSDQWKPFLQKVQSHVAQRGPTVDPSISALKGYLAWFNDGVHGTKFSALLLPSFAEAYLSGLSQGPLGPTGVMTYPLDPFNGPVLYAQGMGQRAVGGAFAAGQAVDVTQYSEAIPVALVQVAFASGTAPPTLLIAGIDDTGSAATTWSLAAPPANNPTGGATGVNTTLSAPVTAGSRQSVNVASATGLAPGQWVTVDPNLPQQEKVLIEAVAGTLITAVFLLAHAGAAVVQGYPAYALTPSAGGRRLRSVTNITIGITGHTAGTVVIAGTQERAAI